MAFWLVWGDDVAIGDFRSSLDHIFGFGLFPSSGIFSC